MKKLVLLLFLTIVSISCQTDNETSDLPTPNEGIGNDRPQIYGLIQGNAMINYTDVEGNNLIDPETGVVSVNDIEIKVYNYDGFYNINEVWPKGMEYLIWFHYSDPFDSYTHPNTYVMNVRELFNPYYDNLIHKQTPQIVFKQQHIWPNGSIDEYEVHSIYAGWSNAYDLKQIYHNGTLIYDHDTFRDYVRTNHSGEQMDDWIFYTVVKEGY